MIKIKLLKKMSNVYISQGPSRHLKVHTIWIVSKVLCVVVVVVLILSKDHWQNIWGSGGGSSS